MPYAASIDGNNAPGAASEKPPLTDQMHEAMILHKFLEGNDDDITMRSSLCWETTGVSPIGVSGSDSVVCCWAVNLKFVTSSLDGLVNG